MSRDDGRLDLAKAIPILEVASRLGIDGLRPAGVERVGPCPVCGGRDRFGINPPRGLWTCRVCATGGDGLALVQHVQGCDFKAALAFLAGEAQGQIDPEELARRKEAAAQAEARRRDLEAKMRARAIRDAREIWASAGPGQGTPAEDYLAGRGLPLKSWPPSLRYLPAHPYRKRVDGQLVTFHEGPCMIAAIQGAEGRVRAVHQTWIDPDRHGQKAQITAPDGSDAPAKLVRGSKKGGAIRLTAPSARLVMAEGIETTLSAQVAGIWPGATFWAGVDLGNMAGIMERIEGRKWSGRPDLSDADAFLPPEGTTQLLLVKDGDSHPTETQAKLEACAIRAMARRPGLRAEIMAAAPGRDLNDMIKKD